MASESRTLFTGNPNSAPSPLFDIAKRAQDVAQEKELSDFKNTLEMKRQEGAAKFNQILENLRSQNQQVREQAAFQRSTQLEREKDTGLASFVGQQAVGEA